MILKNSKSCCRLQLFIIQSKKVSLGFFDLIKHIFSQFLSCLNLFSFFFIDFAKIIRRLYFTSFGPFSLCLKDLLTLLNLLQVVSAGFWTLKHFQDHLQELSFLFQGLQSKLRYPIITLPYLFLCEKGNASVKLLYFSSISFMSSLSLVSSILRAFLSS